MKHNNILMTIIHVLFLLLFPELHASDDLPSVINRVKPFVVTIKTYDEDNNILEQGSGFYVNNNNYVITSSHYFYSANTAWITDYKGQSFPVKRVIAKDEIGDLILIESVLPCGSNIPLEISASNFKIGEKIVVVSCPPGFEQTVSEGIISAVRDIQGFGYLLQISAPLSEGSSGAPVFNVNGNVIGVVTFTKKQMQNTAFATPADRITNLLEQAKNADSDSLNYPFSPEEIFSSKGINFYIDEDYDRAIMFFEKSIQENPFNAETYVLLAQCHGELGNYQIAIDAFEGAILLGFDSAFVYNNLAMAYFNMGNHKAAIEGFYKTLEIDSCCSPAYINLARLYSDVQNFRKAADMYEMAMEIDSLDALVINNLAVMYANLGRTMDASRLLHTAVSIDANNALAWTSIGNINLDNEKYQDAISAFKRAIYADPNMASAHFGLGICYICIGEKDSAFQEYKILAGLDKDLADELFRYIYP